MDGAVAHLLSAILNFGERCTANFRRRPRDCIIPAAEGVLFVRTSLPIRGECLMANGDPVETEEKRRTRKKQAKKPYTKPAFRFERVFETQALSCGKIQGGIGNCVPHRNAS